MARTLLGQKLVIAATILGLLIGGVFLGRWLFEHWVESSPAESAPVIALSISNRWLEQLGVTTATYQQAVVRAGGRTVLLEPDLMDPDREQLAAYLTGRGVSGVVLTGGGDVDPALYGGDPDVGFLIDRRRDDFEIALIQAARDRQIPILGICRGNQILNVALGGTLRNLRDQETLKNTHFGLTGHAVDLVSETRVAQASGRNRLENVLSVHGQAVGRPADTLVVSARSNDGVIEAIESIDENHWIVGVQWHPELAMTNETQNRLFRQFIETAMTTSRRFTASPP